jgi:hypothetical protein
MDGINYSKKIQQNLDVKMRLVWVLKIYLGYDSKSVESKSKYRLVLLHQTKKLLHISTISTK